MQSQRVIRHIFTVMRIEIPAFCRNFAKSGKKGPEGHSPYACSMFASTRRPRRPLSPVARSSRPWSDLMVSTCRSGEKRGDRPWQASSQDSVLPVFSTGLDEKRAEIVSGPAARSGNGKHCFDRRHNRPRKTLFIRKVVRPLLVIREIPEAGSSALKGVPRVSWRRKNR